MNRSRSFGITVLLLASFILFLHAGVASEAVRNTLDLCTRVLIPALFPYLVISSLLVRTGGAELLGNPVSTLTRKLFHLPSCAGGAIILGILCGFPIGAQTACELYRQGSLTKKQAERLIPIANCAGSAFTVEFIGAYLWNSRTFGLVLYILQLMISWILGIVFSRFSTDSPSCLPEDKKMEAVHPPFSLGVCVSDAVASSALSMLKICGFAAFFSMIAALMQHIFDTVRMQGLGKFTAALLELTAGSLSAAETDGMLGVFLAGFSLGWSGLSVLFQSMHFTYPEGLSMRTAVYCQGIRGILCGTGAVLLFPLCKGNATVTCMTQTCGTIPAHALYAEIIILVLFCLFPLPRSLRMQKSAENTHSLH